MTSREESFRDAATRVLGSDARNVAFLHGMIEELEAKVQKARKNQLTATTTSAYDFLPPIHGRMIQHWDQVLLRVGLGTKTKAAFLQSIRGLDAIEELLNRVIDKLIPCTHNDNQILALAERFIEIEPKNTVERLLIWCGMERNRVRSTRADLQGEVDLCEKLLAEQRQEMIQYISENLAKNWVVFHQPTKFTRAHLLEACSIFSDAELAKLANVHTLLRLPEMQGPERREKIFKVILRDTKSAADNFRQIIAIMVNFHGKDHTITLLQRMLEKLHGTDASELSLDALFLAITFEVY